MSPKASGNRIPLYTPSIGADENSAVLRVLRSGRLIQGPEVEAFEAEFAERVGAREAVAVSSGSAALLVAIQALALPAGSEIIIPAYTFVATANAVVLAGYRVVTCDVCPDSLNLDPAAIPESLGPKTAAIIPVHQFGLPLDLTPIQKAAPRALIIEDAACAAGAVVDARPVGGVAGTVACFSFHARKVITTGEGGMITTSDPDLAERLRSLRQHGIVGGSVTTPGYNFRLSELAAALGRVQLSKLDILIEKRQRIARHYDHLLAQHDWIRRPAIAPTTGHVFQSYLIRLRADSLVTREEFKNHLLGQGIGCQDGIVPVHWNPYYRKSFRVPLPVADELGHSALFLPMYADLSDAEVEVVCEAISQLE